MSLKSLRDDFLAGRILKPDFIDRMHEEHKRLFEYAQFIQGTDIARIEIADGDVIMTVRSSGVKLRVSPADKRTSPVEILNFAAYEPEDAAMILKLVDPQTVVFDVGANIGYYALLLGKHVAQVHAFEPIPPTFALLKGNVALNEAANVTIHNFGFSDRDDELTFYFLPEGSGMSSAANLSGRADAQQIRCKVGKLDDFVRKHGVAPTFIKCDVEGAELFVFKGGMQTIAREKPVIFTEMLRKWSAKFGYHPNDIIALLSSVGYRCYAAHGGKLQPFTQMDEQTVETNFFFLHPEKHAALLSARL